MTSAGAHPAAIKRHFGHASITATMNHYGRLFPGEADTIAKRLNTTISQAHTDLLRINH